jgi:hypothetical protein
MIPISYGWAAGDCSLSAYIQSTLAKLEDNDEDVSALGSVMAFLYVSYIILYSVVSTVLGRWVDSQLRGYTDAEMEGPARFSLKMVGGVQFTVLSAIILAATLIPPGSLSLNPAELEAKKKGSKQDESSATSFPTITLLPQPASAWSL